MSVAEPVVPDVDLVSGVLAGDQAAFAAVYDRYADKLFDFAHSMLRSREDAADAVADTFVTTAETDAEAYALLKALGMPFIRREQEEAA